jgi:hypothetical protein
MFQIPKRVSGTERKTMPDKHVRVALRRDASFIGATLMVLMLVGFVTLAVAPAVIDLMY